MSQKDSSSQNDDEHHKKNKSGRKGNKKQTSNGGNEIQDQKLESNVKSRRSQRTVSTKEKSDEVPTPLDAPKAKGRKPALLTENEPKITKKHQKLAETHDVQQLQDIAHQLRIYSIEMTTSSSSGHPTSCASIAEIMSVLFFDPSGMHYSPKNPRNFLNDRFVLSKGHAAPILYAAQSIAGFIDPAELQNLRKFDSDLEGHPTPKLPFVDVATGSLGQGLSVAGGMAYASKYLDKIDNRYYVLIGDGESAEGSIWEACNLASHYKLNNLTLIVDVNRLGQSEETILQHDVEVYKKRFESFGFATFKVDGHNIYDLIETFEKCRNVKDQPQAIIARTFKGKYMEGIENHLDWHGKAVTVEKKDQLVSQLKSLQKIHVHEFTLKPQEPTAEVPYPEYDHFTNEHINYPVGSTVATRKAYGNALVNLSKSDVNKQIVALDGDTKNSTFSLAYKQAVPSNFIECYIAEQNMVGWAQGVACRNKIAFVSTFGAFFARAYDQIRMGGISRSQAKFVGSHSGVSIGEDGPSQMALEDLAIFRAIPDSVVLYPSDAISAERAVELAANHRGMVYIRTSRPDAQLLYDNNEKFHIGQSKVLSHSQSDQLVVLAAGVTLQEALLAQKSLAQEQVAITVIDLFSVKPFDKETVLNSANLTKTKIILTVEDHYLQGGIFGIFYKMKYEETVSGAFVDQTNIRVYGVGVTSIPRSGKAHELLNHYGLDAKSIHNKVKALLQ